MSPRERAAALTACAAVLAAFAAATVMLPLDLRLYDWMQETLQPAPTRVVTYALDLAARVTLAVLITAPLLVDGGEIRRLLRLVDMVPLVISGAAVGELSKTALERLRPSALPEMETGNSLPSGHIMNTTLFAVVAWELAGTALTPRWRRVARTAAVLAVAIQVAARVLRGSHWPSDVAPSILLGIAWMLGARSLWSFRRLRYPALAACAAAFVFFLEVPAARLHVPSVLDAPRTSLATWNDAGAGADVADGSRAAVMRSDGGTPSALEAVMRATCEDSDAACRRVRITINGWTSRDIALSCGWRWYRVEPAAAALHAGDNDVAIRVPADCPARDIRDVAVRSMSLVTDVGYLGAAADPGAAADRRPVPVHPRG